MAGQLSSMSRLSPQLSLLVIGLLLHSLALGQTVPVATPPDNPEPFYFIREYRVSGNRLLSSLEISKAVYPHLGPGRRAQDIEEARAALEKCYHDRGWQAVTVTVPQQSGRRGIIKLEVTEASIGKLSVRGAKWNLPSEIAKRAPSLAPGKAPHFKDIERDIVALNQGSDLKVTPKLNPGDDPGVLDIELEVEDRAPLHGNFEINNRYSPNTVPLRINGGISYSNLWQMGHSMGASFQVAPERLDDGEVYSGFYSLPISEKSELTFSGMKQSSNINTLGGSAVVGQGEVVGLNLSHQLPAAEGLMHSISAGIDYKNFSQVLNLGETGNRLSAPVSYWPLHVAYSLAATRKASFTQANIALNWAFRGMASRSDFNARRYASSGGYLALKADANHLQDLPGSWQGFVRIAGQASHDALINNEQFSAGGLDSVRGYLVSAALGDVGLSSTLELRTPSLLGPGNARQDDGTPSPREWRFHVFADGALLGIHKALPQQQRQWSLASLGIGSSLRLGSHWQAIADLGIPLLDLNETQAGDLLLSFRLWADF